MTRKVADCRTSPVHTIKPSQIAVQLAPL
jgi:hypothetical protein